MATEQAGAHPLGCRVETPISDTHCAKAVYTRSWCTMIVIATQEDAAMAGTASKGKPTPQTPKTKGEVASRLVLDRKAAQTITFKEASASPARMPADTSKKNR